MPASFPLRPALSAVLLASSATAAFAFELEVVNRTTHIGWIDSNGDSVSPRSVSYDGRFAVFSSRASNLVFGDTNNRADLFLHDANSQTLERVSLGNDLVQSNGDVGQIGGVSDDGRYVVFDAAATNLAPGNSSGTRQIYLRDRSNGTTELLSRISGAPAPGASANPRMSSDGRYVVFDSFSAFVPADDNGLRDIYRLDRNTGTFELMSVSSQGARGNGISYEPQISADGSTVLFYTWADNLVAGDSNNYWDIVLRKPATGTTLRVSVDSNGAGFEGFPSTAAQSLSGDGRYAVFNIYLPGTPDDTNSDWDGFRYDTLDGSVQRVTLGPGGAQLSPYSSVRALSRDGQTVLMQSNDPSLVPSNDSTRDRHYVRNLSTGTVTAMQFSPNALRPSDETEEGMLSGDGSAVFVSTSSDGLLDDDGNELRDVLRQTVGAAAGQRISRSHAGAAAPFANGHSGGPFRGVDVSADGRYVVFSSDASNLVVGDFNGVSDVFVRDRLLGMTQRISVRPGGGQTLCRSMTPRISRDGRYIVFQSCDALTPNTSIGPYEVFHYDRHTSQMQIVSVTPDGTPAFSLSSAPHVSDDGRYVAFSSSAAWLVSGDDNGYADTFLRDMQTGITVLASRKPDGGGGNWSSTPTALSGDGRYVLFATLASDLVADDTNQASDAFVFDRQLQSVERVSLGDGGLQPNSESYPGGMSRDGRYIGFSSSADNLPSATSFGSHAYVRDRLNGTTELVSREPDGTPIYGNNDAPRLSDDGNRAAFFTFHFSNVPVDAAQERHHYHVYERDRARSSTIAGFGEYDQTYWACALSGDGDHLVFASSKIGLTPEDGNNQFSDVFLARKLSDFLFADGLEAAQ